MVAGIPNITGHDCLGWAGVHIGIVNNAGDNSGCFRTTKVARNNTYGGFTGGGSGNVERGVAFNASCSNNIYGSSNTVTPLSRACIFCIKF